MTISSIYVYVLIVTSWVYGGSVTNFQEFEGKLACERAKAVIVRNSRTIEAACVAKGKEEK